MQAGRVSRLRRDGLLLWGHWLLPPSYAPPLQGRADVEPKGTAALDGILDAPAGWGPGGEVGRVLGVSGSRSAPIPTCGNDSLEGHGDGPEAFLWYWCHNGGGGGNERPGGGGEGVTASGVGPWPLSSVRLASPSIPHPPCPGPNTDGALGSTRLQPHQPKRAERRSLSRKPGWMCV